MKYVIGAIFFNILFASAVYSYDGITAGELSKDIINQINDVQNNFLSNLKPECHKPQEIELDFLLYKRNDYNHPISLDPSNPKELDPDKKMILIIHGWLQSANSSGIQKLKNAYLNRYDCNVVIVDWSDISRETYTTAYCHMQKMSTQVSKLLCAANSELNMPINEVHIVGYSLGGQLAGISAQYVKTKCKQQIGRITGLDPAGPMFQNLPSRRRLDKADALFVDIIHTDQLKFGFSGNTAHSDFYPNCGQIQPGCTTIKKIMDNTSLADIMCSHHRSLDYMIESVKSDNFIGVSCGLCPRYCRPNIISEVYAIMGEGATSKSHSKFYLSTKNVPPFGEGWTLHSAKLP